MHPTFRPCVRHSQHLDWFNTAIPHLDGRGPTSYLTAQKHSMCNPTARQYVVHFLEHARLMRTWQFHVQCNSAFLAESCFSYLQMHQESVLTHSVLCSVDESRRAETVGPGRDLDFPLTICSGSSRCVVYGTMFLSLRFTPIWNRSQGTPCAGQRGYHLKRDTGRVSASNSIPVTMYFDTGL